MEYKFINASRCQVKISAEERELLTWFLKEFAMGEGKHKRLQLPDELRDYGRSRSRTLDIIETALRSKGNHKLSESSLTMLLKVIRYAKAMKEGGYC